MSSTRKSARDVRTLPVEDEMTIYQAATLKPLLLESLNDAAALEIDLSQVAHIDTAGLQLLMMVKRAAAAAERKVTLVRHSPAVLEAFELVNLGAYFGDPLVMPQPASSGRSTRRRSNES